MWANAQRDGHPAEVAPSVQRRSLADAHYYSCLLYTSDAADE